MAKCNKCGNDYYGLYCPCSIRKPQKVWVTCPACRGSGTFLIHHPGAMSSKRCGGKRGWYEYK